MAIVEKEPVYQVTFNESEIDLLIIALQGPNPMLEPEEITVLTDIYHVLKEARNK